jgi:transposase
VVVCRLTRDVQGTRVAQTQTFGTSTRALRRLSDWLPEGGGTPVGRESTGEFCTPVFTLLAGACAVWLRQAQHSQAQHSQAQHSQALPGRRTDVPAAQWIAELLAHGLVRPSFIAPQAQRELCDLTRYRTSFVRERATRVHRVHKALESANLKLACGATDIMGVSGRAI